MGWWQNVDKVCGGGCSGDVGCAGVLGLAAPDRLGGGAAEGALGDVDGDDGVGDLSPVLTINTPFVVPGSV